eukprot:1207913-Pleurochrysis_carterae.AAC.1
MRLRDVVKDMVQTHGEMLMTAEGAGTAEDKPIELVVMFDGFPVERISICHFCVSNASLCPDLSSQSKQLLRVV